MTDHRQGTLTSLEAGTTVTDPAEAVLSEALYFCSTVLQKSVKLL